MKKKKKKRKRNYRGNIGDVDENSSIEYKLSILQGNKRGRALAVVGMRAGEKKMMKGWE